MAKHKNQEIPLGWGVDAEGKPTADPDDLLEREGSLQPLGGPEVTGNVPITSYTEGLTLQVTYMCSHSCCFGKKCWSKLVQSCFFFMFSSFPLIVLINSKSGFERQLFLDQI